LAILVTKARGRVLNAPKACTEPSLANKDAIRAKKYSITPAITGFMSNILHVYTIAFWVHPKILPDLNTKNTGKTQYSRTEWHLTVANQLLCQPMDALQPFILH
jgi:hypothetical protein